MPEQSNLYFLYQVPSQTNCLQGGSTISLARHFLLTVSCKWQTAGYIVEILTVNRINSKGRNFRGKQKDERRRNILLHEVSRQQTRKRSPRLVSGPAIVSSHIVTGCNVYLDDPAHLNTTVYPIHTCGQRITHPYKKIQLHLNSKRSAGKRHHQFKHRRATSSINF